MATSTLPVSSIPSRCPRHDGQLVEGYVGRLVEDVGGTITSEHRRAWFCIAPGCSYRRVEK